VKYFHQMPSTEDLPLHWCGFLGAKDQPLAALRLHKQQMKHRRALSTPVVNTKNTPSLKVGVNLAL
jgi:hypothetical protein